MTISVHPRVCGELATATTGFHFVSGSSPRVRGTPFAIAPDRIFRRFIPACAGNSLRVQRQARKSAVHPRVCGELRPNFRKLLKANGSSPRVRGTRAGARMKGKRCRFIPACAGNSTTLNRIRAHGPVHPRVCGELAFASEPRPRRAGSSPRVRGTLDQPGVRHERGRFIPACAGNSGNRARASRQEPVHPRVCGELLRAFSSSLTRCGSSPRVRGTLGGQYVFAQPRRFIPACAGNSRPARRHARDKPVHPRVCGELTPGQTIDSFPDGSSPRVRGTLAALVDRTEQERFIPACAGNSSFHRRNGHRRTVHPRVCGELWEATETSDFGCGSSPRVRGTLGLERADLRPLRFIPACAGNSHKASSRLSLKPVHPRVCGELGRTGCGSGWLCGSSPRVRGTQPYQEEGRPR